VGARWLTGVDTKNSGRLEQNGWPIWSKWLADFSKIGGRLRQNRRPASSKIGGRLQQNRRPIWSKLRNYGTDSQALSFPVKFALFKH
jgi:hypothetical protein